MPRTAHRFRTVFVATAALLVASGSAPAARAQGRGDDASAQKLFDEGRALLAQGRFADACPKFAASEQLAPSGGTLLNLADCYEKNGQLASAWAKFHEVAERAHRAGRADVEQMAHDRFTKIEPRLSTLTIVVPKEADVDGLQVHRDGEAVPRGAWGTALPVDGGAHGIEVTAPGKRARTLSANVAPSGDRATLTVPPLEDASATATHATPAGDATRPASREQPATGGGGLSGRAVLGLVVGGAGVVALGVGGAFGLVAIGKNNDAASHCPASPRCNDQEGVNLTNDAKSAATASTIAFAAGGALLAAGVVLFLTAPSSSDRATGAPASVAPRVALGFAPAGLGPGLGGTW
jgi:hypothetical protein